MGARTEALRLLVGIGAASINSSRLRSPTEIWPALSESLPACRSTPEEIKSKIEVLGARYHRYLHQDEFGPTRAERMSALRAMQTCVELLNSLIVNLPQHLALELTTTEPDQSLSFRILRSWTILRGWTMEQIHQAASTELAWRHSLHTADDLRILEEICARARCRNRSGELSRHRLGG